MTRFRYYSAVVLQSFGIYQKNKRMTESSSEMHMLFEGEEFLGSLCWEGVENVEELSMEYWNIRKNRAQHAELWAKLVKAEQALYQSQQERDEKLQEAQGEDDQFLDRRETLYEAIDELLAERSDILLQAEQIKRRMSALKLKLSVLEEEGKTAEQELVRQEWEETRGQFLELRQQTEAIGEKLAAERERLAKVQEEIDARGSVKKGKVGEVYGKVSKATQELSQIRSQLGQLNDSYRQLCRNVGRYLNVQRKEKVCQQACRQHRSLLNQVGLLRQSVTWNKKLITRAGG